MFKILIADDEPFTRRCIIHALPWEENGFSVVASCKNGKEAFEALEEYLPDIVITDVRMPIMDGLDLLKKIQASYPHICVIIISGFEEFDYVKTAMDYGAYGYVLKPLNPDELLTVIKTDHHRKVHPEQCSSGGISVGPFSRSYGPDRQFGK